MRRVFYTVLVNVPFSYEELGISFKNKAYTDEVSLHLISS
jgi:hypothetical protein